MIGLLDIGGAVKAQTWDTVKYLFDTIVYLLFVFCFVLAIYFMFTNSPNKQKQLIITGVVIIMLSLYKILF